MAVERLTLYSPVLVPALHRIQQQFGYLKQEALEQLSKDMGVPQYRLQAIASFFPHFLLTPPKKVVLRVCRDLSCNMAGSREISRGIRQHIGAQGEVDGTSRLGESNPVPRACGFVQGREEGKN